LFATGIGVHINNLNIAV